ncbi:MAG TPA: hypothetical protein VH593_01115 [Ktedonobacteraceae bacterium]|jgi:hypothetical protein
MNIDEQFEKLLANLGVEMEQPEEQRYHSESVPEISMFQASRDHYGVFYRLDIIDQQPELRIMVPVDKGDVKMDVYLVRMSSHTPFNSFFFKMSNFEGSPAYEHGRDGSLQHLLYACAEIMKQLFWSGDLQRMSFPPEITVRPLLVYNE